MLIGSERAGFCILFMCALVLLSIGSVCAEKDNSEAMSAFQEHMERSGSITFRSWNGKALHMDSDTDLTFFPNQAVHMFEWGYTLATYKGTFQIHTNGQITIQFDGFPENWPEMMLEQDRGSLLLRPTNPNQRFVMGTRGGATIPSEQGTYWPFRMLTGEEEQKLLEMIGKDRN